MVISLRRRGWLWLAVALSALGLLAAIVCSSCVFPPQGAKPISGPLAGTAPVSGGASEQQPTSRPGDVSLANPRGITLTVWTTEALSPTLTITTGQVLASQVAAFEAAQPGVRLQFVPKKAYGNGGILDYLLTTGSVVPDFLPDLVFIDVDELPSAAQAEILQPLDKLLPEKEVDDLYPFATSAATVNGHLYGLQFEADLDHLVYNPSRIRTPPDSWSGVLGIPGPYLFPAGGDADLVNDAFWIQYLAVRRPPLIPTPDEPFLQKESLAAVLQFYEKGKDRGVFPATILDYHTTEDCWRDYLAGQASMAQVSATRFRADRSRAPGAAVASIPAMNAPGAPVSRGWALALVTTDPARQAAAVAFMVRWMSPETNLSWNEAAGTLPTRQAALALWDQADAYTGFIREQLLAATPRPRLPNYNQVASALQQALQAVLSGTLSADDAAAQVLDSQK